MKKFHFFLLALMMGFFVSCGDSGEKSEGEGSANTENTENTPESEPAPATEYTLATEGAEVMWMGSKEEGTHYGSFGLNSGSIFVNAEGIERGVAEIDLSAITVLDAELNDEYKGKLAGHLSSEDFFNVAQFPAATLFITGSSKYSGEAPAKPEGLRDELSKYYQDAPTHTVNGNLNVKGEQKPISFPAKVSENADGSLSVMALVTFDRRDYGLRFMSDTESTVYPEIHVGISVKATK